MMNKTTGRKIAYGFGGIVLALIGIQIWGAMKSMPKSPEDAYARFISSEARESEIADPLILAGKKVVPLLIDKISDRSMQRRRYAIGALGDIGDSRALLALEGILRDDTEEGFFRTDALEAIMLIDTARGKALSETCRESKQEDLARACKTLLTEKMHVRRSKLKVLFGAEQ